MSVVLLHPIGASAALLPPVYQPLRCAQAGGQLQKLPLEEAICVGENPSDTLGMRSVKIYLEGHSGRLPDALKYPSLCMHAASDACMHICTARF